MTQRLSLVIAIIFVVLCAAHTTYAQESKEFEFVVERPKIKVHIIPSYTFLLQNIRTEVQIEIQAPDTSKKYIYKLAGGQLTKEADRYELIALAEESCVLNIYEIENGEEYLVFGKEFEVKPEARAQVAHVYTDSVCMNVFIASRKLMAKSAAFNFVFSVVSFEATYTKEGQIKTVAIEGDKLNDEARRDIAKLPMGSMIYYEKIRIKLYEDNYAFIAPWRTTIIDVPSREIIGY